MTYNETIVVNEQTGGRKAQKEAQYGLIPAGPLRQLAQHYGRGARKYESTNWRKGTAWHLNFDAMMRHAWEWYDPALSDIDEETGSNHLVAVIWHCMALLEFTETHPELDDRPKLQRKLLSEWASNLELAVEFRENFQAYLKKKNGKS